MSQRLLPLFDSSVMPPARVTDFFYDSDTRIIYFLKSIENKKVKFSTKTRLPKSADDQALAVIRARRFANKELRVRLNKKKIKYSTLIKDELELWLKVKESEGHKYDTLNNIRRAKRQIDDFWGGKYPSEITRDNLTVWYQWWSEHRASLQMENAIKYMRNFCRYLAEKIVDGYPLLPAVPTIKDPGYRENRAKRQKKKERIILPAELASIYKAAPDFEGQVATLIMYTMATRITETFSLEFERQILLDLEIPVYRWSIGDNKADLWGSHALHPRLLEPLRHLKTMRALEGTKLLFPQQGCAMKPMREQMVDWDSWRTRADLGWHWTPHTFRHTCLSNIFSLPASRRPSDGVICKQYRVSMQTAMEHYIKPTQEGILLLREAIKVDV